MKILPSLFVFVFSWSVFAVSEMIDRRQELKKCRQELTGLVMDQEVSRETDGVEETHWLAEQIFLLSEVHTGFFMQAGPSAEIIHQAVLPNGLIHESPSLVGVIIPGSSVVFYCPLESILFPCSKPENETDVVVQSRLPPPVYIEAARNLIVNYVPDRMSDEEFRAIFEQFGEVESARLILDRQSQTRRGYGFVMFKNSVDAGKAIAGLNGFQVYNKRLKVEYAKGPGSSSQNQRTM